MANLESGKRLADRYLLQERLGDGGHAEVWAALDTRDNRRVALKFLHRSSCPADDCWHVLQHEAAMAQRLDHPGVLRVEAPQRDGEWVFLPMECADGGDVRALRGAPWRQVLPVLLQVALILEHAHSRGVVHRDIKPGNVLFAADGAVRVTDFGTAARTGSTLALADGSPFSASPQQLAGLAATISDDLYGLGALAYELLSGYPPYYPDFDARRVQDEMPAPLAAAHPAPPQLLAFIMTMLEREPRLRPDLRQSIDFFTLCLKHEADVRESGAAMIVPESPAAAADSGPGAARRWHAVCGGGTGRCRAGRGGAVRVHAFPVAGRCAGTDRGECDPTSPGPATAPRQSRRLMRRGPQRPWQRRSRNWPPRRRRSRPANPPSRERHSNARCCASPAMRQRERGWLPPQDSRACWMPIPPGCAPKSPATSTPRRRAMRRRSPSGPDSHPRRPAWPACRMHRARRLSRRRWRRRQARWLPVAWKPRRRSTSAPQRWVATMRA